MTRAMALLATLVLVGACGPEAPDRTETGPATRIVTLAPHLTELVFAAGLGEALVGVSDFSDYPPQALELPVVSDAFTVDQEQLRLLAPDVLLAWRSGTPRHLIDELSAAGYRVEVITTRGLDDIAEAIVQIGALANRRDQAMTVAAQFRAELAVLRAQFAHREPVSAFYQVSMRPLYTINGDHYIGEILELCGGRNVFADLGELAPAVTVEAVVERNPEALFATDIDGDAPFADWERWPHLDANRFGNHFIVDADQVGRPALRLVAAAEQICGQLEMARSNRRAVREDQATS